MLKQSSIVTLLLLLKYCQAQPACTTENAKDVCVGPVYTPDKCIESKCERATFWSPTTASTECEIPFPSIKEDNSGKTYFTNVDYKLECTTTINGVIFTWYKDNEVLNDFIANTYTIKETTETAATKYRCGLTIGEMTGVSEVCGITRPEMTFLSEEVTVTVVAPGKVCAADDDCIGSVFSGKCDLTDPKRCVCAANYVVKEDTCSKSGATVVSTNLPVVGVAILSQLIRIFKSIS